MMNLKLMVTTVETYLILSYPMPLFNCMTIKAEMNFQNY